MVQYCVVPQCKSSALHPGISFHSFPKDKILKKKWIIKIRRDERYSKPVSSTMRVCSLHFDKNDFKNIAGAKTRRLKRDAIPSIFSFSGLSVKKQRQETVVPEIKFKGILSLGKLNRVKKLVSEMASKPSSFKKLMVHELTTNFRKAVKIETVEICHPQKEHVCIKIKYVGINATDVNITKGRYFSSGKIPFGIGFEGVGEIVELGDGVKELKVGQSVAFMNLTQNVYAEYVCVSEKAVYPIPKATPDYLTLLVSGLTASIGLDKSAHIVAGETVLITAAAGGAGHIAVQWAKAADCHVIATCSTEEKENVLKDLGCDRIINYKKENLADVLSKEYPKGVDVIWETIGGQMLIDCIKNLAIKGRLLIVGGITGYKTEEKELLPKVDLSFLPEQLLFKSAAVQGFLLSSYTECFATYFTYMSRNVESKKLKPIIDTGVSTADGEFVGMEGIIRGVEHLHSGKNIGKVVARIS